MRLEKGCRKSKTKTVMIIPEFARNKFLRTLKNIIRSNTIFSIQKSLQNNKKHDSINYQFLIPEISMTTRRGASATSITGATAPSRCPVLPASSFWSFFQWHCSPSSSGPISNENRNRNRYQLSYSIFYVLKPSIFL